MAKLIHSAKPASKWTEHDLAAYNITVVHQDITTFFGMHNLPQPTIDPAALTATEPDGVANDDVYRLLHKMDHVMSVAPVEELAVSNFTMLLLRAMGYDSRGRDIRMKEVMPLTICGETRHAKSDICIVDENGVLLLIQEDKERRWLSNPEPQLVAGAIAAFAANNVTRSEMPNMLPLDFKVMAGITMRGTAPFFYKIEVTAALVNSVRNGAYPQAVTTVYAHVPSIPRRNRRWSEGIKTLDNRHIILSCYEAFKQFVN